MSLSSSHAVSSVFRKLGSLNFAKSLKTGCCIHLTQSFTTQPSLSQTTLRSTKSSVGMSHAMSSYRSYSSTSKTVNAVGGVAAVKVENKSNANTGTKSDKMQPESGQVFLHPQYNMYVCWHPEVPFPYEMTKPIDVNAPITDSNLKIQALTPVREAYSPKHKRLIIRELTKLTYATKHRFFGMYGKSKRAVLKSMDPNKQWRLRKYL